MRAATALAVLMLGLSSAIQAEDVQLGTATREATIAAPGIGDDRPFTHVAFRVSDVDNPDRHPLELCLAIVATASGESRETRVPIGCVALYPADRGGEFSVALSSKLASTLKRDDHSRRLAITLSSSSSAAAWGPLSLTVGDIRWN